jgi:hypothetical protein
MGDWCFLSLLSINDYERRAEREAHPGKELRGAIQSWCERSSKESERCDVHNDPSPVPVACSVPGRVKQDSNERDERRQPRREVDVVFEPFDHVLVPQ